MDEVKSKILNMSSTTCMTFNIYGMDGTGKTNLVAACLGDPDILTDANYKVFWIDLNRLAEGDLLDRMYHLYHKLQIADKSLCDLPDDNPGEINLMRIRLLNLFTNKAYSKAIIVLDNVNASNQKAIEYFGVCRMVIISQERFNLNHQIYHLLLQDAFTYQETMEVFRKALDADLQPKHTHLDAVIEWCRGDLTTTILCANLMADDRSRLLNKENSAKVWKGFKEKLCKKDSEVITKRNLTIEMRLKNLTPSELEKYLDLAVFVTDVNITTNVLSLLWDMDETDVENFMTEFCNRSFAVREYNDVLDSYVFGVNHNYLNYLKMKHTSLKSTHRRLVEAYKNNYMHYHKFKDDNYIYQYIGYHLQEAGLLDDFEIYRDLKFIEAKIRATGIADVLQDFEVYYDNITRQNEIYEREVREITDFVERFGQNLERYPMTNVLQSALQLPSDSLVYELACRELGCSNQFGLFFDWLYPKKNRIYYQDLKLKQNLEIACFTYDDPTTLLIGTENGDIQLWDYKYDKLLQDFKGHSGRITYLRAAESKFLSISEDGTVKVWKLDNKSRRNSIVYNNSNNGDMNIPSPACIKQKNYQKFFANNFTIDNCVTYCVDGDSIISADFSEELLVVGTAKGKLILWENDEQKFEKDLKIQISAVQFSHHFNYIYAALKSDVLVYATSSAEFISKACCKDKILSLHTMQSDIVDEFIVVQEKQVISCKILLVNHCIDIPRDIIMKTMASYTCSSMTDKYLVIGSSDHKIFMWDLTEKCLTAQFDAQYGHVICIDAMTNWDDHSIEILLTSFEDKSVRLWHVNPEETAIQQAENVEAFAAYWEPSCRKFATAIVRKNKLTISENSEPKEEEMLDEIVKIVDFNESFVYAHKSGKVRLRKDGIVKKIMDLKNEIIYLEALDEMVVAATGRGILFVYYRGSAHKLRGESRGDSVLDSIRCSFNLFDKLLVMSQRKISYWDFNFDSEQVLYAGTHDNLSFACVSDLLEAEKLCVTFGNSFKMIHFDNRERDVLKIENCIVKKTASTVTSCCFSMEGKYLAFGTERGDIEIFNTTDLTVSSLLKLHQSPVHFLKFSHEGPILLSLAEQMAWWNVKLAAAQLQTNNSRRSFRSRSNSGKSPGKKPPLPLNLTDLCLTDGMLMKRGRFDKEYLLAAIKLHGMQASHIVCADRFQAFLSVDNLGNLYNMRMIEETRFTLTPLKTPGTVV